MSNIFSIKKIVRDDGATLEIDAHEVYLDSDNQLLVRADPSTSAVNFTEANGGEMLAQRLTVAEQPLNGLILPKETPYWRLVQRLTSFWQINHTYKIVYIKSDGALFVVDGAWINSALQITPTPKEEYSKWSVSLTVGNELWREYAEDEDGGEIDANMVMLPSLSVSAGGELWDDIGEVFDDIGEVWTNDSNSGVQTVIFETIKPLYPTWTVVGPCSNPKIQNNTTNTTATYNGAIAAGQTLTVNFKTSEAHLDGALVSRLVDGSLVCNPGENRIGFSSDDASVKECSLSWDNIIG